MIHYIPTPRIVKLSYEERYKLITSYVEGTILPSSHVHGGYVDEYGNFQCVGIRLHRAETKRQKLKEYMSGTKS